MKEEETKSKKDRNGKMKRHKKREERKKMREKAGKMKLQEKEIGGERD